MYCQVAAAVAVPVPVPVAAVQRPPLSLGAAAAWGANSGWASEGTWGSKNSLGFWDEAVHATNNQQQQKQSNKLVCLYVFIYLHIPKLLLVFCVPVLSLRI